MTTIVYVDNSNAILLTGLHDELTNSYINDATVTVTVKDASGTAITGQTWPTTMDYVAASNGNYRAILKDVADMTPKAKYTAHIVANGGTNRIGTWEFPFKPITRTGA